MKKCLVILLVLSLFFSLSGCSRDAGEDPVVLTLATTTSTYDSGLLDVLLPDFEEEYGIEVDVISLGTGQALALGRRGDADILLIHARALEDNFVAEGFGTDRWDVMYNDFVYLGPSGDPAGLASSPDLTTALKAMVGHMNAGEIDFVSRGDDSGTHTKELAFWKTIGMHTPEENPWYLSTGQGMGDALITANEMNAYILTDRGTYLAMMDNLPNLGIVFQGDDDLFNPYGIIPVDPDLYPHVHYDQAMLLVEYFISEETQQKISTYGADEFGQPLFFPNGQ